MKKAVMLTTLLAASALLASPVKALELGDYAPALKISQWVKGDKVNLKEGRGKYIYVVEFWATWCGPCRASIPHITEIQKEFKNKGVVVVGVTSGEQPSTVKQFVDEMGSQMDYVVAMDKGRATWEAYASDFGVRGIPHSFIIDRKGKLVWHGHPMDMDDQLETLVRKQPFQGNSKELSKAKSLRSKYYKAVSAEEAPANMKAMADKVIKSGKKDARFLSDFARVILTSKKIKHRDKDAALKAAKLAYQLSEGEESDITAVYARALFESGDAKLAARYIQEAIEVCEDEDRENELTRDLKKYKEEASKKT